MKWYVIGRSSGNVQRYLYLKQDQDTVPETSSRANVLRDSRTGFRKA